jgi:protein TonB
LLRKREERGFRRRWAASFGLVTVFHLAVIAMGVAYSYWHVEELTPQRLRVTFMSMTPSLPPMPQPARGREVAKKLAPPPPPPAGGHAGGKKVAMQTTAPELVAPPPSEIVQPPETPPLVKKEFRTHDDEYDEDDDAKPSATARVRKTSIDDESSGRADGVTGGVKGGTVGGTVGGTIGGVGDPEGPRSVSSQVGSLLKESGNMPPFSSLLMHDKMVYVVGTKICVSTTGAVYKLIITKRSGTVLDAGVINTVKTWRYRPMTVNNTPVRFCYPVKFAFKSES